MTPSLLRAAFVAALTPLTARTAAASQPVEIATPGGKVVSATAEIHRAYHDEWHYAPARVEGNLVYVSGVLAGARDKRPMDTAALEEAFRRAWRGIKRTLQAAGSDTDCIVDLTSFHLLSTPLYSGTADDHVEAFRRVKDEFVPAPYPAWTGIGVAALLNDTGVAEIKIVARLRAAR